MLRKLLLASLFIADLNPRVTWELDHIGYPNDWVKEEETGLQVAIIGAGMAGIASAYGLFRVGIHQVALFDECEEGLEGPWLTYAQMKVLRTPKEATGPSLFTPSLTFQAWYEENYGERAWNILVKADPQDWGHYLNWLRKILKLDVKNNCRLVEILPLPSGKLELRFDRNGQPYSVTAKKVILATGRKGFGGYEIPSFMDGIPFLHSSEITDYSQFKNKKISILGCGTAAFDAAGAALEAGAGGVTLHHRRAELPKVNKWDALAHVGMEQGFYKLPDDWKFKIVDFVEKYGTPPPEEALTRVKSFSNFYFSQSMEGFFKSDVIILGTGYRIDVEDIVELKAFASQIKLWRDLDYPGKVGSFPYLGPHYQFLEKNPGACPHLKHIYCFNYGALASHGLTSSSIDALSVGAERLCQGIAADFFIEDIETFYSELEAF
jgi:cation diffusion facilitator CzcD-associated flavoprotein CzcO